MKPKSTALEADALITSPFDLLQKGLKTSECNAWNFLLVLVENMQPEFLKTFFNYLTFRDVTHFIVKSKMCRTKTCSQNN